MDMTKILLCVMIIGILLISYGCCDSCGCDGCGGCCDGCCGDDDSSKDKNNDTKSNENVPNNLGNVDRRTQGNVRSDSVCEGVTTNTASISGKRASAESGYIYTYSYTIKPCTGNIGYNVLLSDGTNTEIIESGKNAPKGIETVSSADAKWTSSKQYSQICLNTGSGSSGKCSPLTE